MIKIEKRLVAGMEDDYNDCLKAQEEAKNKKNAEKVEICERMKSVDVEDVLSEFTTAMTELDNKFARKAKIHALIIAECFEDVEVEYPDEEEVVDLDEENAETVE